MYFAHSRLPLSHALIQFESTTAKLSDITAASVSLLNTMCECSLPPSHVYANEFTCAYNTAQQVIYRAKLRGVEARDCENLMRHFQDWVDQRPSLPIQGNRLRLDSTCDLAIDSLDIQPACVIGSMPMPPTNSSTPSSPTTSTTDDGGLSIEIIAGAAAAGAVILILLILLILVCCCCICCRQSSDR